MTLIDKENHKGSQSRLAEITRQKRSEKGKLGAWIAKAITRKQGCEDQIRNTISKRNESERQPLMRQNLKQRLKRRRAELQVTSPFFPCPPEMSPSPPG